MEGLENQIARRRELVSFVRTGWPFEAQADRRGRAWRGRWGVSASLAVLAVGACVLILNSETQTAQGRRGTGYGSGILAQHLALTTQLFTQMPIPDSFDVRWGYAECRGFESINGLGSWGSSCKPGYAMLVSAMLSARACRNTKLSINVLLSPQSIIDCYQGGDGCADGTVENALTTLETMPAVDVICMPFAKREGLGYVAQAGKCKTDTCNGATGYYVKASSRGAASAPFSAESRKVTATTTPDAWVYKSGTDVAVPQSVEPLQRVIVRGGPVLGKLNYYMNSRVGIRADPLADVDSTAPISTFADSTAAIYRGPGPVQDDEAPDAVHDVLVLGWGHSNGEAYWLVMDTIGDCYGDRGVFKIAMGVNAGNFEGYGFTYADLDVDKAVGETAESMFFNGCSHDIEVKGSCRHSGILSSNGCQCKCSLPRWTGDRCDICNLQCRNGGIINNFAVESAGRSVEKCRCDCPEGFSGVQCEQQCPNVKPFTY